MGFPFHCLHLITVGYDSISTVLNAEDVRLYLTWCDCGEQQVSSLTVNGPLWTGPLHDTDDVKKMTAMAKSWGWIEGDGGSGDDRRPSPVSTKDRNLKKLLDIMLEESNPDLQVGYIKLDEVLILCLLQSYSAVIVRLFGVYTANAFN